jgi:hypothetical protein
MNSLGTTCASSTKLRTSPYRWSVKSWSWGAIGSARRTERHSTCRPNSSDGTLSDLDPDRLALLVAELSDPVPAENYVRAGHDLFGLGR